MRGGGDLTSRVDKKMLTIMIRRILTIFSVALNLFGTFLKLPLRQVRIIGIVWGKIFQERWRNFRIKMSNQNTSEAFLSIHESDSIQRMDEEGFRKIVREELANASSKTESEEECSKTMSCDEKIQAARDARNISHEKGLEAEEQSNITALEFIKLEVQIAALLLGFTGFLTVQQSGPDGVLWIKIVFAIAVTLILLSLIMGLIHLKRYEKFADQFIVQRFMRFLEWNRVVEREISFEEGKAYHRGTAAGMGLLVSVPMWTWVLQTIFLGAGVSLLFLLFSVSLFLRKGVL